MPGDNVVVASLEGNQCIYKCFTDPFDPILETLRGRLPHCGSEELFGIQHQIALGYVVSNRIGPLEKNQAVPAFVKMSPPAVFRAMP